MEISFLRVFLTANERKEKQNPIFLNNLIITLSACRAGVGWKLQEETVNGTKI